MDFFQSQESLTSVEWVLRAVVGFFFLVIVGKVLGQRAISQLRLLDFVIALVIGNIIAHPLSDQHLGLKGSVISTIVLVTLYLGGIFIILKWPWLRMLINSAPITLVKDGEIIYKGLKTARISLDLLLGELRKEKVADVKSVALAFWEADGTISIFLDPKYQPITPSTMQLRTEPFDLPRMIIKEGKINSNELLQIQKDEDWVISKLENFYQTEIKNVLLATVDKNDNLKVFLYK
ncbi:MAG: YetF domain-containing protein [Bacillus sp. (in: firmicutes)]